MGEPVVTVTIELPIEDYARVHQGAMERRVRTAMSAFYEAFNSPQVDLRTATYQVRYDYEKWTAKSEYMEPGRVRRPRRAT
jgi:hypothetical protein